MGVLPYLTSEAAGVGGVIKVCPADFVVDEIPLYPACGEGTHVYFCIEKCGLGTMEAVARIARALGKRPREIGYGGLKDAGAVTRQTLSVEHVDPKRVESLDLKSIRILSVTRHTNKLKIGHLRANRFDIKLREVDPDAKDQVDTIMETLTRRGVPNYYGPQRFGARSDNAHIGRAVVGGEFAEALSIMLGRAGPHDFGQVRTARQRFDAGQFDEAADAWPGAFRQQIRICRTMAKSGGDGRRGWAAVDGTLRRLYVSAFQSALFNRVLAERIAKIDRIEEGDIAWKHANGACFRVEDVETEKERCDAFEISPTGPVFGYRMTEAFGEPGQRESAVLAATGLDASSFRHVKGMKLTGARRPLRVLLESPETGEGRDQRGYFVRLSFTLPPGSYATCVTREVCKNDTAVNAPARSDDTPTP